MYRLVLIACQEMLSAAPSCLEEAEAVRVLLSTSPLAVMSYASECSDEDAPGQERKSLTDCCRVPSCRIESPLSLVRYGTSLVHGLPLPSA